MLGDVGIDERLPDLAMCRKTSWNARTPGPGRQEYFSSGMAFSERRRVLHVDQLDIEDQPGLGWNGAALLIAVCPVGTG